MPAVSVTVVIGTEIAQVYHILTDVGFLASVFPGVTHVDRKNDTESTWHVELRQGFLRRRITFEAKFDADPPVGFRFAAAAAEVDVKGRIVLTSEAARSTRLRLSVEYEGQGPLRFIINAMFAQQLGTLPDQLRERIEAAAENTSSRPTND